MWTFLELYKKQFTLYKKKVNQMEENVWQIMCNRIFRKVLIIFFYHLEALKMCVSNRIYRIDNYALNH